MDHSNQILLKYFHLSQIRFTKQNFFAQILPLFTKNALLLTLQKTFIQFFNCVKKSYHTKYKSFKKPLQYKLRDQN